MQQSLWRGAEENLTDVKPILRWAGGKGRWLRNHHALVPQFNGRYFEPFLGGAAVFFFLTRREVRPFHSILSDTNLQLISTYTSIRDNPDAVVDECAAMQAAYSAAQDKRSFYERQRDIYNSSRPRCNAANFIFLNATCWNGLWRVNSKKEFNVPYGAPKNVQVMPASEQIHRTSRALQLAELRASSWEAILGTARPGDFVFLDPPYLSDVAQNGTKYGREEWGLEKQIRLAEACAALDSRGVAFLLTNSGEEHLADIYKGLGLTVNSTFVARAINSKPDQRGGVRELIVTNRSADDTHVEPPGKVFSLPARSGGPSEQ